MKDSKKCVMLNEERNAANRFPIWDFNHPKSEFKSSLSGPFLLIAYHLCLAGKGWANLVHLPLYVCVTQLRLWQSENILIGSALSAWSKTKYTPYHPFQKPLF